MISQEDLKAIGQEVGKIVEDNISPQFQAVYDRIDKLESLADKLLLGMLDLQSTAKETEKRLARLEELAEKTFKRMDAFMKASEINETEIVALRAGLERAEARIAALEQKLQIA